MNVAIRLENNRICPDKFQKFARRGLLILALIFQTFALTNAQNNAPAEDSPKPRYTIPNDALIIENTSQSDIFGFGKTVVVRGNVTQGVIAFGGDVIIEGRVEGDVATIGGSIFQTPNSFIGGDVIVLGGTYHHGKGAPVRNPDKETVMYAGYEEELRGLMQNPTTLFSPSVSPAYLAQRILSLLFWFLIALFFATLTPGAVSRAVTRLNLQPLQIAAVGTVALLIASFGIIGGLSFLPTALSAITGIAATIFLLLAYTFGRVAIQAATGNFVLKKIYGEGKHSESVALFVGAFIWTLILSLPFLWLPGFILLILFSFGIVLTARRR